MIVLRRQSRQELGMLDNYSSMQDQDVGHTINLDSSIDHNDLCGVHDRVMHESVANMHMATPEQYEETNEFNGFAT